MKAENNVPLEKVVVDRTKCKVIKRVETIILQTSQSADRHM